MALGGGGCLRAMKTSSVLVEMCGSGVVWLFPRILNKDFHKRLSTTVLETAGNVLKTVLL